MAADARKCATCMPESNRNTGPNALRRGRSSAPGASFFVTICVAQREPKLVPDIAQLLVAEALRMSSGEIWTLRCMTVMPDHLHLLFALGVRLTLARRARNLRRTKDYFLLRNSVVDVPPGVGRAPSAAISRSRLPR